MFDMACSLLISVDVEAVDLSVPSCPVPGELLALSQTYQVNIPAPGMYQIETPLDTPYVVDGPFFAGFFFAEAVDTLWNVSIITDDTPVPCENYNIWDTTIGFVDLTDTGFETFPSFPGRILLFSGGTTGGSGGIQPEPSITILSPQVDENIRGTATIWAAETSGSNIIDKVQFHFRAGGPWYLIGEDIDGSSPLRNSVDPSGTGDGWAIDWDYSILNDNAYWLKATAVDTLGRTDVDSVQVNVDPTPPDPTLTSPTALSNLCLPQTLVATSTDQDISLVRFEKKNAEFDYQLSLTTLNQNNYGDVNGNPGDGNLASNGEYGDYYCGPVAGAIAFKYWFDQGYIFILREGVSYIPLDTAVERLAATMRTRTNNGTNDEMFYSGLMQYIATHGNELSLDVYRQPDYNTLRTVMQERGNIAIYCLSGDPGLYLVASGVTGLEDSPDQFAIKISDPVTGSLIDTYFKEGVSGPEVLYDGVWHSLDKIITIIGKTYTVIRDFIGADNMAGGGWTFDWTESNLADDSLYFISATAIDATDRADMSTSLVQYKCGLDYLKGDYDDDGFVNVGDALYLSVHIYEGGPAPAGGAGRADANCDGNIDISDVIFIIKYVFEGGIEPCY
jgi:hypothetical protein